MVFKIKAMLLCICFKSVHDELPGNCWGNKIPKLAAWAIDAQEPSVVSEIREREWV
jgi:hypothetical protein